MLVTSIILIAVLFWIAVYLFVFFYVYIVPDINTNDVKSASINPASTNSISNYTNSKLYDPYLSSQCSDIIDNLNIVPNTASVIIYFHDGEKNKLLDTVESILQHSYGYLSNIVIIDDQSKVAVKTWTEWSQFHDGSHHLKFYTTNHYLGPIGGKHYAITTYINDLSSSSSSSSMISKHMIVVVDAEYMIMSPNWLASLYSTLLEHPQSVVYPVIDIIDEKQQRVIKSSNVVAGFDWGLQLIWEDVKNTNRIISPTSSQRHTIIDEDTVVTSPSFPTTFAIMAQYYKDIGGFNTKYESSVCHIELSIRVWACGGSIIRQPCSRVAMPYPNLYEDVKIGIHKEIIDQHAFQVAEQWMTKQESEYVFMHRFSHAIPYQISIPIDSRSPQQLTTVNAIVQNKCGSFSWYLNEVYPGLKNDQTSVYTTYRAHIDTSPEEVYLKPLLDQYYNRESRPRYDPKDLDVLKARAEQPIEMNIAKEHQDKYIPPFPPAYQPTPEVNMEEVLHQQQEEKVRKTLKCEDENFSSKNPCDKRAGVDLSGCISNRFYMMFGCPKTCGLCGADGLICFDYFENKCKQWKNEGKCDSEYDEMKMKCRYSCGHCTRDDGTTHTTAPNEIHNILESKDNSSQNNDKVEVPPIVVPTLLQPLTSDAADPYVAQMKYNKGDYPDPTVKDSCQIGHSSDAKLLNKIQLYSTKIEENNPNHLKLFCGIYTMEEKHKSNVHATVSTWGKKCTGFMAFSTATDPTIPAVKIDHEGPEEYENMWQKSRSIWKYIGQYYSDQFDYFLLGGDDMFYIIENLFAYLNSREIQTLKNSGKGSFIGRRFFPPGQEVFNSGGAGYILDRAALKILVDNIDTPPCHPHKHGFWEDVNVANCLRAAGNILPYDTRDTLQRERFHPFNPGNHLEYRIPPKVPDWYAKYNPDLKIGFECCSDHSVSFHYCPESTLLKLYSYFYHCESKTK